LVLLRTLRSFSSDGCFSFSPIEVVLVRICIEGERMIGNTFAREP
jgi:hypothetical protein